MFILRASVVNYLGEQMLRAIVSSVVMLTINPFGQGAVAAAPELLSLELVEQGWIQLFDGQTLFGWQPTGDAKWEVDGSTIRTSGTAPGFLMTTCEWADYELHVEFKADAKTNSGVFLRTPIKPTDPAR